MARQIATLIKFTIGTLSAFNDRQRQKQFEEIFFKTDQGEKPKTIKREESHENVKNHSRT